jgi:acylphosphatase
MQGEEEAVQKLLKDVDKGPRFANVVKLEKNDISTQEGESSFVVR